MTGGEAADPGDYPFIARMSMRRPKDIYCSKRRCGACGATLITAGNVKSGNPAFLMTAGHCCAELDKDIYKKSNIWPLAKNITKYDITFELGAVYDKTCNYTHGKYPLIDNNKKFFLSMYNEQNNHGKEESGHRVQGENKVIVF